MMTWARTKPKVDAVNGIVSQSKEAQVASDLGSSSHNLGRKWERSTWTKRKKHHVKKGG
jgi:hypothetical protein